MSGEQEEERPEQVEDFAGAPDGFERLWTPHRMVYIDGADKPADTSMEQCPFCRTPHRDDATSLIVHRGQRCYAVLNLYPYSPGHVLLCPYRHVADYTELSEPERTELGDMAATTMTVIRATSAPAGFNLGMNLGRVAGAGISAHLHQHVVPRWEGDANFLPIIAQTKALPQVLADTRELLARAWQAAEAC